MKATLLLVASLFLAAAALADEAIPGLPVASEPLMSAATSPLMEEQARRFKATKDLRVPLPKKTPFDAEQAARRAYLRTFRIGYRQVFAGYTATWCVAANTSYREAEVTGHAAGTLAAIRAKAKKMRDGEPPHPK